MGCIPICGGAYPPGADPIGVVSSLLCWVLRRLEINLYTTKAPQHGRAVRIIPMMTRVEPIVAFSACVFPKSKV